MKDTIALQPELVLNHQCKLAESPLWDVEQQLICWVDILKGEVHQYSIETKKHTVIAVNQMIGAIGLCANGNFIAALQNGFGFIDRSSHQLMIINDPEAHLPGNRFNEGKCAPDGRFWAGTLSLDETAGAGSVYCLQTDLSVSKKIQNVTISNGIAWSLNHCVFYYIDTPTQEIVAYDYDTATGIISNKRTVITVAEEQGHPDGMTIDTEGMLWIALWGGWKITRWNPYTGKKLLEIKLPVSKVSSCIFGGPGLEDLFITTAAKDLTEQELKEQPLSGSVFVIKNCGFKGLPTYHFQR